MPKNDISSPPLRGALITPNLYSSATFPDLAWQQVHVQETTVVSEEPELDALDALLPSTQELEELQVYLSTFEPTAVTVGTVELSATPSINTPIQNSPQSSALLPTPTSVRAAITTTDLPENASTSDRTNKPILSTQHVPPLTSSALTLSSLIRVPNSTSFSQLKRRHQQLIRGRLVRMFFAPLFLLNPWPSQDEKLKMLHDFRVWLGRTEFESVRLCSPSAPADASTRRTRRSVWSVRVGSSNTRNECILGDACRNKCGEGLVYLTKWYTNERKQLRLRLCQADIDQESIIKEEDLY